MSRRVAITGAGILCALGRGGGEVMRAALGGTIGIGPITRFDASGFHCRIAGEVHDPLDDEKGPHDRFARLALAAASDAIRMSGLDPGEFAGETTGTLIGTGLGGSETQDAAYSRLYREGQTRVPPMSIPMSMYNAATSAVAARFGARGPSYSIVSACSSGAHSIGQAASWVRDGLASRVLAGASDAPLTPAIVRAWESLRVLSNENENPKRACRAFSVDRAGLVLAEGAAVVVLEDMETVLASGRLPLGEVLSLGMTSDAGHVTDPSADGAARAMRLALDAAGLRPEEIDAINAHGTGTKANDAMETKAIKQVFGERSRAIPISATKTMHGHAMGASGAIELVISLLAANEGLVPPTMNFTPGDPECDLDYVPDAGRNTIVNHFLSSSFGFGGMNAVLAIRTARQAQRWGR